MESVSTFLGSVKSMGPKALMVAAVGAGTYGVYVCVTTAFPLLQRKIYSRLVCAASRKNGVDGLRKSFRNLRVPSGQYNRFHSHGASACDRTIQRDAFDDFITLEGAVPYSVSMSERDIASGAAGSRCMYFAKDLAMDMRDDKITSNNMLLFMDTDYYIDMYYYAAMGLPMFLYTFVPTTAGGSIEDGVFCINNNEVQCVVNGGAEYAHEIWDYGTDCLIFHYWWGSQIYLVEATYTSDPQRRVVGLFPVRTTYGPLARFLGGKTLKRMQYEKNGINIIKSIGSEKQIVVSLSQPGVFDSVTLDESTLRSIIVRTNSAKTIILSDVERVIREMKIDKGGELSAYLFSMLSKIRLQGEFKILTRCALQRQVQDNDDLNYQTLAPLIFEDGKAVARIIGPQLATGNVVPMKSFNNDTSSLENRVMKYKNPNKQWPNRYNKYVAEFLKHVVPEEQVHTGFPVSYDDVLEKQNRPSQRAGFELAKNTMGMWFVRGKTRVKTFMKSESYPGFKAPRTISTVDPDMRTRYSSYMYAVSNEIMKRQKWYAFSLTPLQIADKMMTISENAEYISCTDFSAFDATRHKMENAFVLAFGKRFFAKEFHKEWTELHSSQFNAPAVSTHGVRYNTGDMQLSGSPDTSTINSLIDAMIAYITLREQGLSREEAFEKLGIYGGDDGATPNADAAIFEKVSTILGHYLKIIKINRGEPVPFLGRLYLDPWTTPNSILDVNRQVRRLHLTTSCELVPAYEAALRKAESILITDPNTPILASWAEFTVSQHCGKARTDGGDKSHDMSWFHTFDREKQFPQYERDHHRMWEVVASQLGMMVGDLRCIDDLLKSGRSNADFPTMSIVLPTATGVPVAVGGVVIEPEPLEIISEEETKDGSTNIGKSNPLPDEMSSYTSSETSSVVGTSISSSAGPSSAVDLQLQPSCSTLESASSGPELTKSARGRLGKIQRKKDMYFLSSKSKSSKSGSTTS